MIIPIDIKSENKAVSEISHKTKDKILVVGKKGYGKSRVLEDFKARNDSKIILDGTLSSINYSFIYDNDINNLYIICHTIKQMLKSIRDNYKDKYDNNFILMDKIVSSIISSIDNMKKVQEYTKIDVSPDFLLETLVHNLVSSFNTSDITLIIDDFDKVFYSSRRYQRFIYFTLQKYLKLILTVSDRNVYDSEEKLNILSKDNDLVILDYSLNVYEVYNILLHEFNIEGLLSYETIQKIIDISDGNLNVIFNFINYLKQNMYKVSDHSYDSFLLNYLEEYSLVFHKEEHTEGRKLHI